ncbi:MAG: DNA polymerase III subunit delta' [Parcubacteria group bacterium Gr01-1014_70]|nr:MAG: DNA polymerase III subunit delta' [Parcubacteria group bacterium Gr01-1014_70]
MEHQRHTQLFDLHIRSGAMSHAYLCSGPRGVGKMAFVRRAAAAMLCEKRNAASPNLFSCGLCTPCLQFGSGTHPDVCIVDTDESKETSIRLEDIQRLRERVNVSPYGGTHICILHDVSKMTHEAANAFLKVLEEPRSKTVFFLLARVADSVPGTVRSRTWHMRFWPAYEEVRANEYVSPHPVSLADRLRYADTIRDDPEAMSIWFERTIGALSYTVHESLKNNVPGAIAVADACRMVMERQERFLKPYAAKRVFLEDTLIALSRYHV